MEEALDQDMYRRKYNLLTQKYKQIHLSNCKLRNRVYHVKKEIRYLKRLKRILITQLSRHNDQFMTVCLEIPDSEPGSNVEDQIIAKVAESAVEAGGSAALALVQLKKKKSTPGSSVQASPVPSSCPKEELRLLAQISAFAYDEAKLAVEASVSHIIDAVISESRQEKKVREEGGQSVPTTPAQLSPNPSESHIGEELALLGEGEGDETDNTDLNDTDPDHLN